MRNDIKDANLALLIGLKRHLEQADQLRAQLDVLLRLAKVEPAIAKPESVTARQETEGKNELR